MCYPLRVILRKVAASSLPDQEPKIGLTPATLKGPRHKVLKRHRIYFPSATADLRQRRSDRSDRSERQSGGSLVFSVRHRTNPSGVRILSL